jgi:RimJ/RimL family protein N-acetyltransferase
MPLEGRIVLLREERLDDTAMLLSLRNDMATQGWNQALPPDFTEIMDRGRQEKREFSTDRRSASFIIEHRDTGEALGRINYSGLQPRWSATVGISTLKKAWGTQVAFDAQEVLLHFLFHDLGLRVVRLWTHGANDRAIRLAERSGFRVGMRAREAGYKGGRLLDMVQMDVLRDEYYALHPELQDTLPKLW